MEMTAFRSAAGNEIKNRLANGLGHTNGVNVLFRGAGGIYLIGSRDNAAQVAQFFITCADPQAFDSPLLTMQLESVICVLLRQAFKPTLAVTDAQR